MNIAIDYDDTYTLDPNTWDIIITTLEKAGHEVYCVTKRYEELADDIKAALNIPIIFTPRGMSKLQATKLGGINIDVWVDDKPQSIIPYNQRPGSRIPTGFARW